MRWVTVVRNGWTLNMLSILVYWLLPVSIDPDRAWLSMLVFVLSVIMVIRYTLLIQDSRLEGLQ